MIQKTLTLALLSAFALPAALYADERDDRIRALEERLQRLEDAKEHESKSGEASDREKRHFTDDYGDPRWGHERPHWNVGAGGDSDQVFNFQLGGYFSTVYRDQFNGRDRPSTFDQHRFVPQLGFTIAEKLKFRSEIEFEGGGADADFLTDNEILVEYAELEFEIFQWLRPTAGLLLIPFGYYNLNHDDPLHDLFDRPFVARRVAPSAFDQPGFGAIGDIPLDGVLLDYNLALVQGFKDNFSANGGARGSRQSFREDENSNKALFLRVGAIPDMTRVLGIEGFALRTGVSFNFQTVGPQDDDLIGYGFDWGAKWDNESGSFGVSLEGEWAAIDIQRDPPGSAVERLYGYYAQATLRWRPWEDRAAGGWLRDSGYIGLALRWEENDLDDRQLGGALRDDREALTVGLVFRPFLKTVIRAEWKFINSKGVPEDEPSRFVFSVSTFF